MAMRQVSNLMLVFLLSSCGKDCPELQTHYVGEPFILRCSECAVVLSAPGSNSNDAMTVCFDKVVNEGRCMWSACYLCFGGGRADIGITATWQSSENLTFNLSVMGCGGGYCHQNFAIDTMGYRFCLQTLAPHPDTHNVPIPHTSYSAELLITAL